MSDFLETGNDGHVRRFGVGIPPELIKPKPRDNEVVRADPQMMVLRREGEEVYKDILWLVKQFSSYVGRDGKKATSPGGLVITINKKIVEGIGCKAEDIRTRQGLEALRAVRNTVAAKVEREMAKPEDERPTRRDVKTAIYKRIGRVISAVMEDD